MFTVKLYDRERLTIVEADSVTVVNESTYLRRVTIVRGTVTETYDVGIVTRETANRAAEIIYDRAIVENSDGRTTEVIRTRSIPPASEYPPPPSEDPDSAYAGRDKLPTTTEVEASR